MVVETQSVLHVSTLTHLKSSIKNPTIKRIDHNEMPDTKEPKGLDAKRQWYLYYQIRPFCASMLQADLYLSRRFC